MSVSPLLEVPHDSCHILRSDVLVLKHPILLVDIPNGSQVVAPLVPSSLMNFVYAAVNWAALGDEVVVVNESEPVSQRRTTVVSGDLDASTAGCDSWTSKDCGKIEVVRWDVFMHPTGSELVWDIDHARWATLHGKHDALHFEWVSDLVVDAAS